MSAEKCDSCGKPKGVLTCDLCEASVCKACIQFLSEETFSFLPKIPEQLTHKNYCPHCYDTEVAPELDSYNEVMERAKQVFVFFVTQRKEIPLIRKAREGFHIPKCIDRDETILRLAFLAALEDYNGIVNVEVKAKKVRNEAYQTSEWSGSGTPALVDASKIELQDLRNQMYR